MSILHNRRKTDQLVSELYNAGRKVGILYAVSILKAPALMGDAEGVVTLADQLTEEAGR